MGKEKQSGDAKANPHMGGRNDGKWGNGPKPKFIEGYLDTDDKKWLHANVDNQLVHVAELLQSIEDEYSISCKYDPNSHRYLASLTCRVQNHFNSGCILVSRGATPIDALYALAYRHFVKFDGKWQEMGVGSESLWD